MKRMLCLVLFFDEIYPLKISVTVFLITNFIFFSICVTGHVKLLVFLFIP